MVRGTHFPDEILSDKLLALPLTNSEVENDVILREQSQQYSNSGRLEILFVFFFVFFFFFFLKREFTETRTQRAALLSEIMTKISEKQPHTRERGFSNKGTQAG